MPHGAHLRPFTNHAGMPTVLYGPGDVSLAHDVDEHINEVVSSLVLSTAKDQGMRSLLRSTWFAALGGLYRPHRPCTLQLFRSAFATW